MHKPQAQPSRLISVLIKIQRLGDKLPHPTALFFYLCLIMLMLSALGGYFEWSATHPTNGHELSAKSLLTADGLTYLLSSMVKNFMGFAPLGPVLLAMLGIGLAEHSGFLSHMVSSLASRAKKSWLSYGVVLGGVLSNIAADAGYVVYIPLCALLFKTAGRHPIAGIAAAFAGVSGGYSANVFVGPVDVILSGISQDAARQIAPDFSLLATSNYFFLLPSTFLITLLGGLVTDKLIEPFLNNTSENSNRTATHLAEKQNPAENTALKALDTAPDNMPNKAESSTANPEKAQKAMRYALGAMLLFFAFIAAAAAPETSPLRNANTQDLLSGPGIKHIVVLIALAFAIAGMIYGKITGVFQSSYDWVAALEKTFATLAGYLVLMFFAAQFVAWFSWSQLGPILAINGANWLSQAAIPQALLLVCIIMITAMLNLFIGSASAKWGLLAPVLVPMMLLLNVDPDWVQMAYRIGDSSSNLITPLMPYFALVLAFAQQEDEHMQIGGLLAIMLPYTITFLSIWTIAFLAWWFMGLPLGV